jgi:hypothetical protein
VAREATATAAACAGSEKAPLPSRENVEAIRAMASVLDSRPVEDTPIKLEPNEEVPRKPVIVYECFDQRLFPWKSTGDKYNYVHLWFRNEPTGEIARDAAAKLSWWDIRHTALKPLFSVDGKWYEISPELGKRAQAEHTTNLLPNSASHGLDLFVCKPGEEDWSYGLDVSSSINERYRLHPGIYKVRATISCEGYSKDFWFRVITSPTISVREYLSPDGAGLEVRDEVQR